MLMCLIVVFLHGSCKEYLDYKPNIKMAIPKTLEDAELLLNNYSDMNTGYPHQREISSDDYFLTYNNWLAMTEIDHRNLYCWNNEPLTDVMPWQGSYKVVYIANQVIDLLGKLDPNMDAVKWKQLDGSAHFFRAFAFHQLLSTYTVVYNKDLAISELGIPIRVNPNIDERVPRSSQRAGYDQVISDLKLAAASLPNHVVGQGLPNKAASYAALARVYLDMQDYEQAYLFADAALQGNISLLDYNDLVPTDDLPFSRFNKEVIFPATASYSEAFGEYYCYVDTLLYDSYHKNDLRKELFFKISPSDPNYMTFKGSYDNSFGSLFVGFTAAELYLIRAECAVRRNDLDIAITDMNTLLERRWVKGAYVPVDERDSQKLLSLILQEKRKELVFRGLRWTDLKRLNLDPKFRTILKRNLDGKLYKLEPNSFSYGILLPLDAINIGGLIQNKR
jgi:tetratricopeptide (TPR) repeat protein